MPDPARVKPWRHSENQAGTCGHVASGGGGPLGNVYEDITYLKVRESYWTFMVEDI